MDLVRSHAEGVEEQVEPGVDRFFRAAQENRFARLHDRNDLWQILMLLTERKAADQYRRANAQKRAANATGSPQSMAKLDDLAAQEPDPAFVAAFNENLARALRRLGDSARDVALLRMEGYENQEIADRLQVSLTTVERKLRVVREVWEKEFAE